MALVGVPQHITVVLGTGWAPGAPWGLVPGTVINLQWHAAGPWYTEDGTAVANGVYNRLAIAPRNLIAPSINAVGLNAATSPTGAAWTNLGYSYTPTTAVADYTWNSVWTRNPTSYVVSGFTPGSGLGFMTSGNLCINPEVFSAYGVASEQEWANAQMALRGLFGFPNCIQVTLGAAFAPGTNGLVPGLVLQLRRVLASVPFRWTEDGTDNPNATTNRMAFQPTGTPGAVAASVSCGTTGPTSWINIGNRGVSAAGYIWYDVWNLLGGFSDVFNTSGTFLTTAGMGTNIDYNAEVFSAIEYCGGAGWDPRNSPDLLMMKRAP